MSRVVIILIFNFQFANSLDKNIEMIFIGKKHDMKGIITFEQANIRRSGQSGGELIRSDRRSRIKIQGLQPG